jgi:YesN/AraC family two-component response regulator
MRFHQETGMSFSEYVTGERIRKAIEIMKTTDMSTDEIAEKVGYPNTNYFVKVFKKHTGKTISEFRKNR